MRKFIRILIPLLLVVSIILCLYWYLFIYDRDFTKDMLLSCARRAEAQGNHTVATWFYNTAYRNISDNDSVACELAEQYKENGNYTKAEFTLSNAIADGGGVDLYIALCKTYVEQDKLLDAVNMLNGVKNPEIKDQLDAIRPAAPTAVPEPGFYNQYISVTLETAAGQIYVNPHGAYPCTIDGAYTDAVTLVDGENKIYAVTVAENGLVSPLAVYVYTVGGVVELMQFSDPAIEATVREKLNMPEPTELYTNDLWTITDFTVPADRGLCGPTAFCLPGNIDYRKRCCPGTEEYLFPVQPDYLDRQGYLHVPGRPAIHRFSACIENTYPCQLQSW